MTALMNQHDREMIDRISQNWRLTPATLATKITKGQWIAAPWLKYVSTRVAHGIAKGGARIIISAPPRHGKSELIDVNTPIWVLENFPRRNVILASYGADLSVGFGRRVRNTIRENEHLLNVRISDDSSQAAMFNTNQGGYMASVGLGGAITGRGAHVLLIDDYIKEIKEALSPAYREYAWNWFVTVAMTRLEPGASVIIIATRWHSDDLIGRILKNFPGEWENICCPAIALEGDILGRKVGEPLFPERYGIPFLESQKELLGSVFFNALYQQQPVDEAQKLTQTSWLKECNQLPALDFKWARIWDLAATEGGGDYTVGSLLGYSKSTNVAVIGNIVRHQISPGKIEKLVRRIAVADGTDTKVLIEKEPGSAGKHLVDHYEKAVLPEFSVDAVPAVNSKLIRAQPFLAAAEAGKVYLLDESIGQTDGAEGGWQDHFIREFETFPGGNFDDQVDTVAAGYNYLSGKKVFTASWGRAPKVDHKTNSKHIRKASFMVGTTQRTRRVTFGR
jgi:predicted phage terminase large subunit-like protein